jgi:acyl-CoA thioesterase
MDSAEKVVNRMFASDWFSQWLGIQKVLIAQGHCKLKMKVRKEMLNGFGTLHGGITFSLADSALAFASNAHGRLSVALEASISFPLKAVEGDELTAVAEEQNLTDKTGIYYITVTNQRNEKVGLFRGTVYRTEKKWFPEDV